jgi:hypothetical protein
VFDTFKRIIARFYSDIKANIGYIIVILIVLLLLSHPHAKGFLEEFWPYGARILPSR